MKERYSIGEIAQMMGVSVQTLRKYCNRGLITPESVDPKTGYRFFSFNQMHVIDKIIYFRQLGMSLSFIEEAIQQKDTQSLITMLLEQRGRVAKEVERQQNILDCLDWYIGYFQHRQAGQQPFPYLVSKPKRYVLAVKCHKEEQVADFETRLAQLRHSPQGNLFRYLRQYGYVIDFDALLQRNFESQYKFIYVEEIPPQLDPDMAQHVLTIPAGDYLCFFDTKALQSSVIDQLRQMALAKPSLVLVNEYEKNLSDYEAAYELEVLYQKKES